MEGKGSISFLMPIEQTATTTSHKPNKISRKWQRKTANRRHAKNQRATQPANQQKTPTEQAEQDNNEENNNTDNWQCPSSIASILAEMEAEIEEGCAEAAAISAEAVNNASDYIAQASSNLRQPEKDEHDESWEREGPTPIVPELTVIYDSGATSSCGRIGDPFLETGKKSDKIFQMPNDHKSPASDLKLLEHNLRSPARDVHMVPDLKGASLISTGKLADAGYISIFDKEEVCIYDSTNTEIIVTRGAILKGYRDKKSTLWHIPLRKDGDDNNTKTVIVDKPPTEFLPSRPPPTEAIFNVYEIKTQPELVRYFHAAAGFPTKPTWLNAIKKGFYTSWPGLTDKIVQKYFPESEETWKGHARKIKSGLRSTKKKTKESVPSTHKGEPTRSKEKSFYIKTYDLHDDFKRKMYTDQTG